MMVLNTNHLAIAVNNCKSEVSHWQQKIDATNNFTQRNFYRSKLAKAKQELLQAEEAFLKTNNN